MDKKGIISNNKKTMVKKTVTRKNKQCLIKLKFIIGEIRE